MLILALSKPAFKIVALQNTEFKCLADFKILAFQNPEN